MSSVGARAARDAQAALADQRWDDAADIVERHWSRMVGEHLDALRAVTESLPDEVYARRPGWEVVRAYVRHLSLPEGVRPAAFTDEAPDVPDDAPLEVRLTVLASRVSGARGAGQLTRARRFAAEIEAILAAVGEQAVPEALPVLPDVTLQLGYTYLQSARLDQAARTLRRAYRLAEDADNPRVQLNAAGELAWLLAVSGLGRHADGWLACADAVMAAHPRLRNVHPTREMARAVRAWGRLRFEEAAALVDAVPLEGAGESSPALACTRALIGSRMRPARALEILTDFDVSLGEHPERVGRGSFNHELGRIVRAELLFLNGRAAAARNALAAVPDATPPTTARTAAAHLLVDDLPAARRAADATLTPAGVWPRLRAETLLVRAAVNRREHRPDDALRDFTGAIRVMAMHDVHTPPTMLDRTEFVALADLAGADVPPQLKALLDAPIAFPQAHQPRIALTPQERRVVSLLRTDRTEQELANLLVVSRNTVHVHLQSLFRKLGVHDRASLRIALRTHGLL